MKRLIAAALILLTALSLFSCGEKKEQLNLYTWEGMFPQEILDGFEAEYGIEINYVNFDTNETMLSKLDAAGGGDYDLVIADDYILEQVISKGLASELDRGKISNYGNIDPFYQGQFFDPENKFTVPFGAGVQTIVYDPSEVDIELKGYADLWNESLRDSVGIISNFRVINGMALKVLGESYNTTDTAKIEAAGEKLASLAPNIRLIKDDYIQDDLLAGEISAAVMYTSQVTLAKMTDPSLEVVFPEEGVGFGIMPMFIPSKAPNADAAYKFIDYVFDAERGAKCFEHLGYYCTNKAAEQYISEEFKTFLILPEDMKTGGEMIENVPDSVAEVHNKVWTDFRNLCD